MLKASLKNKALRKRATQFTQLVRHSAVTPRTGKTHQAKLVSNGEVGVTFIGHSSFFLQIGGQNVVIDPNFARWLFVLKRLRQPGFNLRDLPPRGAIPPPAARSPSPPSPRGIGARASSRIRTAAMAAMCCAAANTPCTTPE